MNTESRNLFLLDIIAGPFSNAEDKIEWLCLECYRQLLCEFLHYSTALVNQTCVILEELEVLESIYMDELFVERNECGHPKQISMQLHPATGDEVDKKFVCITLVLDIPQQYPDDLPEISLKNPRGLGEEQVISVKSSMLDLAKERQGGHMLYEMIELVVDSLTQGNVPRCACPICYEHFTDMDMFTRTQCYHFFHVSCLDRYVRHELERREAEREDAPAHTKHEALDSDKVPCPVCREEITLDKDQLQRSLSVDEEETATYVPTPEIRQWQRQMSELREKQKQKGGIIDMEEEKNKFLVTEDTVFVPISVSPVPKEEEKEKDKRHKGGKGRGQTRDREYNRNEDRRPYDRGKHNRYNDRDCKDRGYGDHNGKNDNYRRYDDWRRDRDGRNDNRPRSGRGYYDRPKSGRGRNDDDRHREDERNHGRGGYRDGTEDDRRHGRHAAYNNDRKQGERHDSTDGHSENDVRQKKVLNDTRVDEDGKNSADEVVNGEVSEEKKSEGNEVKNGKEFTSERTSGSEKYSNAVDKSDSTKVKTDKKTEFYNARDRHGFGRPKNDNERKYSGRDRRDYQERSYKDDYRSSIDYRSGRDEKQRDSYRGGNDGREGNSERRTGGFGRPKSERKHTDDREKNDDGKKSQNITEDKLANRSDKESDYKKPRSGYSRNEGFRDQRNREQNYDNQRSKHRGGFGRPKQEDDSPRDEGDRHKEDDRQKDNHNRGFGKPKIEHESPREVDEDDKQKEGDKHIKGNHRGGFGRPKQEDSPREDGDRQNEGDRQKEDDRHREKHTGGFGKPKNEADGPREDANRQKEGDGYKEKHRGGFGRPKKESDSQREYNDTYKEGDRNRIYVDRRKEGHWHKEGDRYKEKHRGGFGNTRQEHYSPRENCGRQEGVNENSREKNYRSKDRQGPDKPSEGFGKPNVNTKSGSENRTQSDKRESACVSHNKTSVGGKKQYDKSSSAFNGVDDHVSKDSIQDLEKKDSRNDVQVRRTPPGFKVKGPPPGLCTSTEKKVKPPPGFEDDR